jgi:hypothetical protein
MSKVTELKSTYYQFQPDFNFQIYISFESAEVEKHLLKIVNKMGFKKIEAEKMKKVILTDSARILKIEEANPKVSQLIDQTMAMMDKYGPESITPRDSYNVYRYRGIALMVYADASKTWELGIKNIYAEAMTNVLPIILNRYLSFTLATYDVIGFWGVPVEEGVVVMKQHESRGEAVFIDLNLNKVYTVDGVKPIKGDFQILRLDESLKDSTRRMSKEDLISFLTTHTTYFGYNGVHYYMKKKIVEISKLINGTIYPVENFKHRTLPMP